MPDCRYLYVHRDDMRLWQLATLEVQQTLQALFEKAGITAWCGGGTLIGAVRNGGFLYWDNDLDMFFQHKDYRRIMIAFWKYKFLTNHSIYYNLNGYWEEHIALKKILNDEVLDEKMLDFELSSLTKTMIKIFKTEGVPVKFYDDDLSNDEQFVRIKHYVKHHLTRARLAYLDDDEIDLSKKHNVLPNVCFLPMVNVKYRIYFLSNMIYLCCWIVSHLAKKLEVTLGNIVEKNDCAGAGIGHSNQRPGKIFDATRVDSMPKRLHFALRRIIKMATTPFAKGNCGQNFIAYRQAFFRFEVLPYREMDVFPLRKLPFENAEIYVPNDYERVLKVQFGDYMKVPPKEKRFALPFFIEGRT